VARLAQHLKGLGAWSDEEQERTTKAFDAEMAAALKEAQKHGSVLDGHIPPLATMFEDVFKVMPPHLHEQMRQASEEAAAMPETTQAEAEAGPVGEAAAAAPRE